MYRSDAAATLSSHIFYSASSTKRLLCRDERSVMLSRFSLIVFLLRPPKSFKINNLSLVVAFKVRIFYNIFVHYVRLKRFFDSRHVLIVFFAQRRIVIGCVGLQKNFETRVTIFFIFYWTMGGGKLLKIDLYAKKSVIFNC